METIFEAFTTVSTQHIPQWFIKINSELSMIWYWDFTLPNVKFIYGICQNELHFRFRLSKLFALVYQTDDPYSIHTKNGPGLDPKIETIIYFLVRNFGPLGLLDARRRRTRTVKVRIAFSRPCPGGQTDNGQLFFYNPDSRQAPDTIFRKIRTKMRQ